MKTMNQIEMVGNKLIGADYGFYVDNEDNGRTVVVECMAGGRYLVLDEDKEVMKLTDDAFYAASLLLQ